MLQFDQLHTLMEGYYIGKKTSETIQNLRIDTRNTLFGTGDVFFALKGNKSDGHYFVPDAYSKGCCMFVLQEEVFLKNTLSEDVSAFITKDVLKALQLVAQFKRKQYHQPLVAITGSNAKTIVKEWLFSLLSPKYYVCKSPKSYNSQIGVALSLWQLTPNHQLAIIEAGISRRGEMDILEKIIQPEFGIFTNIGSAHDEGFPNKSEKAAEKALLFTNTQWVVACYEHTEVIQALRATRVQTISWSTYSGNQADYNISYTHAGSDSTVLTITHQPTAKQKSVLVPFSSPIYLENLVHCLVLIWQAGWWHEHIQKAVTTLRPLPMRLELKRGMYNSILIDDAYNNDLAGLTIALDFMAQHRANRPAWLILSELIEAGQTTAWISEQVLHLCNKHAIDKILLVGEAWQLSTCLKEKYPVLEIFKNTQEVVAYLQLHPPEESCVLIKGARTFHFEQIVQLLSEKTNEATLEIDLNALAHNYLIHKKLAGSETKVMTMVKSFAYGAGMTEVAAQLQHLGVDYMGVAYTDEGVALRQRGIFTPIMILNPQLSDIERILQYRLEPVVYSLSQLHALIHLVKNKHTRLGIHIEIDSGMHRLGTDLEGATIMAKILQENDTLFITSLFTHLAASEDPALDDFTKQQLSIFDAAINIFKAHISYPFLTHAYNTGGIVRLPSNRYSMVRLGIGLYGIEVHPNRTVGCKPVATLTAPITQIKKLAKGETVGYNRKGIVHRDSTIGIIGIGYGDGLKRHLSNGVGYVFCHEKLAPIVGNICMDMTMIDLTDIPDAKEGDTVEIFGPHIPIEKVAKAASTIPYEILTSIAPRVKRVFYQD